MAWNSLPDFIRDPTSSTDCLRRLLETYLFTRYYSASSALEVLNDNALYKSTHSLTHSLIHSLVVRIRLDVKSALPPVESH